MNYFFWWDFLLIKNVLNRIEPILKFIGEKNSSCDISSDNKGTISLLSTTVWSFLPMSLIPIEGKNRLSFVRDWGVICDERVSYLTIIRARIVNCNNKQQWLRQNRRQNAAKTHFSQKSKKTVINHVEKLVQPFFY